jgi:hypothetical protein
VKKSKAKKPRPPNQFQLQPGATGTRDTQKRYGLEDDAPLSGRIVTNVELRRMGFWRPPEEAE